MISSPLVDAHCHLQASSLQSLKDSIIQDIESNHIHCICNATEPGDWDEVIALSNSSDMIHPSLGIHPWYIPGEWQTSLSRLEKASEIRAIGEAGLDGRHTSISMDLQIECFEAQMEIAGKRQLPLIAHCIAAFDELIGAIKRVKPKVPLIIHAFNGSAQLARSLAAFGCYFSLGGTVTYPYSKKRAAMVEYVYTENLMLVETDSPDLPPSQKPEGPNVPTNLPYIIDSLSAYLDTPGEIIASRCTSLAAELFSLKI